MRMRDHSLTEDGRRPSTTVPSRHSPLPRIPSSGVSPGLSQPSAPAGTTAAAKVPPKDARALSPIFFARLRELDEGTHEYQYVRNTLVEMNQSLVRFATRGFRHRGAEESEDIFQSGMVGLIKAIDRFDLSREVEFSSFALPYVRGEIKRHLRDNTWAVHVPRHLQEQRLELSKVKDRLEARLSREPTVAELAVEMGIGEAGVVQAMTASNAYKAMSLDVPASGTAGEGPGTGDRLDLGDVIGAEDPALELFENCHSLAGLLAGLDEREIRLLRLRFGEERTQQQIGDELGCTQMHVSRLLHAVFAKLRAGLLTEQ
jgi:RNA polymerase sigma-B factor